LGERLTGGAEPASGRTLQRGVVQDHGHTVGRKPHVQLEGVGSLLNGQLEGG
jgi:hypothetical protein